MVVLLYILTASLWAYVDYIIAWDGCREMWEIRVRDQGRQGNPVKRGEDRVENFPLLCDSKCWSKDGESPKQHFCKKNSE